jgi:hypothetical protein
MTGRVRFVQFICAVCNEDFTVEIDPDEDDWIPDLCEEHEDWEWDSEKGEYVDPNAEEEEESDAEN